MQPATWRGIKLAIRHATGRARLRRTSDAALPGMAVDVRGRGVTLRGTHGVSPGNVRWPARQKNSSDLAMALPHSILDALRRFVRFDEGLDVTGYVASMERHFCVQLSPAEVELTYTLGELTDLIARTIREAGRAGANDDVWPDRRRITAHEFGIDANELNPGIRYAEDLNCVAPTCRCPGASP